MPKGPEQDPRTSETTPPESADHGRRDFIKTAAMTAAGIATATALSESGIASAADAGAKGATSTASSTAAQKPIVMRQQTVTPHHQALHAFAGKWNVSQKQWRSPDDAVPTVNTGTSVATLILNGLGISMDTTLSNGWHGIAVQTFNPLMGRFELMFLDSLSDQGVVAMVGTPTPVPSRAGLRAEFGDAAQQVRTWNTSIIPHTTCVPGSGSSTTGMAVASRRSSDAKVLPVSAKAPTTEPNIPLRLVENQVSPDKWVLEFFVTRPDGTEFMTQQNVFTRA